MFFPKTKLGKQESLAAATGGERKGGEGERTSCDLSPPQNRSETPAVPAHGRLDQRWAGPAGGRAMVPGKLQAAFGELPGETLTHHPLLSLGSPCLHGGLSFQIPRRETGGGAKPQPLLLEHWVGTGHKCRVLREAPGHPGWS